MARLRIRRATVEDFETAGRVTHAAYAHSYDDLSAEYLDALKHPEALAPEYDTWLAERGGAVVGVVSTRRTDQPPTEWIEPGEFYFRLLAVAPEARGTGVARALIDHVFTLARESGAAKVSMNSGPHMTAAHRLYRGLGFSEPEGRRRVVNDGEGDIELHTFVRAVDPAPADAG